MLRLRKIKESDLENIIKWRMMPEVTKYMYTDPILDLEKQILWFNEIQNSKKDIYWIIEIDNTAIGVISINDIDQINKRCKWGYYIGDMSFRGRGVARLLECNVYDYVFNNLKLNKLCGEVLEFNDRVVRIHEKFGSEVEGILRDHIYKNNKFYNVVIMGITAEKWKEIKGDYIYEKIDIE